MNPSRTLPLRRILVRLLDAISVVATLALAFCLRFDFRPDSMTLGIMAWTLPWVIPIYLASLEAAGVYRGLVYFSSFDDLLNIVQGIVLAAFITAASVLFARQGAFPRSILLLHPILAFVAVCGVRFMIRYGKTRLNMPRAYGSREISVLLIGAGDLGESLLRQMLKTSEPRYKVVGFLDDDPTKWGMRIHGRPVIGGRQAIKDVLDRWKVDQVVIAISARRAEILRSVIEALRDVPERPELRIAPSLNEMLNRPGPSVSLRKVNPADLLNRSVVQPDSARIGAFLKGKTVLVTGAGGTIGAELCRQALLYEPAKLILVENHATSLFYTEGQVREHARGAQIIGLLADLRDQSLVTRIFEEHRPQVVLHAAAHKHVAQLESNVCEGIANNVLATYFVACAARDHGAEVFLLVSTDKAVRPSSVMGATKRAAELVVKSLATRRSGTRFLAVRFGNVLGSSGSVLEIFQLQIARGGPLTVTHEQATRFFMTVEEAVNLILQSASMAKGGEIFVLKMGAPVRILDMAQSLIQLCGLENDQEIDIRITGLKPGEKLHEELMEDPAGHDQSEHPEIMLLKSENSPIENLEERILDLELAVRKAPASALVRKLRDFAPSFVPDAAHRVPPTVPES